MTTFLEDAIQELARWEPEANYANSRVSYLKLRIEELKANPTIGNHDKHKRGECPKCGNYMSLIGLTWYCATTGCLENVPFGEVTRYLA